MIRAQKGETLKEREKKPEEEEAEEEVVADELAFLDSTREKIWALYAEYKRAEEKGRKKTTSSCFASQEYGDSNSRVSLAKLLAKAISCNSSNVMVLPCTEFDLFCRRANMTEKLVTRNYYSNYFIPPRLHPSEKREEIIKSIVGHENVYQPLLRKQDMKQLSTLFLGSNTAPPEIAVVFDGIISEHGSVLSNGVWLANFCDTDQKMNEMRNWNKTYFGWKRAHKREIVVLSHWHSNMFWHFMIGQYFRIFPLLDFLLKHNTIPIHLQDSEHDWNHEFFGMLGISPDRFVYGNVNADIIYYPNMITRDDIPSAGLSLLLQTHIWDMLGMTKKSIFCNGQHNIQSIKWLQGRNHLVAQHGISNHLDSTKEKEINIVLSKRPVTTWSGRAVLNHDKLKSSLEDLAKTYHHKLEQLNKAPREPIM